MEKKLLLHKDVYRGAVFSLILADRFLKDIENETRDSYSIF